MQSVGLAAASSDTSTQLTGTPWWELTVTLPCGLAEDAGALLVDAGAMGAETLTHEAHVDRAWQRHASMGPRQVRDVQKVSAASDTCVLVASFEGHENKEDVWSLIRDTLVGLVSDAAIQDASLICRNDAAWAHAWREHYKPLKIGRSLWIVPRWDTRFQPPFGSTVVRIDPGMAFGTGQHATTSLCLKAIERRVAKAKANNAALQVLDVGAGSGILAIAALSLGASRATLTDIDRDALLACQSNVDAAGLTQRATVLQGWPAPNQKFGLVVANILANTLIDMMPELIARLEKDGTLLLSGILTEQADAVTRAVVRAAKAAQRPIASVLRLQHDKWVALAFGASLDA